MKKVKYMNSGSIYPDSRGIPAPLVLKKPVMQREYLVKGVLKRWRGSFCEVYSPVLAEKGESGPIGVYPLLTGEEAMEALAAAAETFDGGRGAWPAMTSAQRIAAIRRFTAIMKKKRAEVARLIMWEIGKPYGDALKEFDRTMAYINDSVKIFQKMEGRNCKIVSDQGIAGRVKRVPRGVALCIGPYNYPLYETFTAVAPALLAGNTVVFKPPRQGGLLFGPLLELFRDNFPEGAVNVIYGHGEQILPPLMSSGMVDIFAFIGTSPVADRLKRLHPSPQRLKSVLGLEAKNPAIILPDADLDRAVKESVLGALAFNGQRCAALKIFFVHAALVDDFLRRFTEEVSKLKSGMPWEKDVFITPLVEEKRVTYLSAIVEDAVNHGAAIVNKGGGVVKGNLFTPAVLYPVDYPMRICREEQFGPVVPIVPYSDIEEPLQYVCQSRFGQQASLFGKDPVLLKSVIDVLIHHVSRVNINCKCQRTPDSFPFTGRKDSAEDVLSVSDALTAFTTPAVVTARAGDASFLHNGV